MLRQSFWRRYLGFQEARGSAGQTAIYQRRNHLPAQRSSILVSSLRVVEKANSRSRIDLRGTVQDGFPQRTAPVGGDIHPLSKFDSRAIGGIVADVQCVRAGVR